MALPKALLAYLDARRGPEVAERWLRDAGLKRADMENETHTLPVAALRATLDAFVGVASREAIVDVWPFLLEPATLGAYVRVFRGVHAPEQAFSRLGASESEYGRTARWEVLEARRGYWRGRVLITHDPTLEENGLLALIRAAELKALPALFGFGPGEVVARGTVVQEQSSLAQEYEVRWRVPRPPVWAALGALMGTLCGSLAFAFHTGPVSRTEAVVFGAVLGGMTAAFASRAALRHAGARGQAKRVAALERTLELREAREIAKPGEALVAGQYRIKQRMGAGASGVIYEAERVSDGLPVALKLLRVAAAHEAIASDRLRREAEALRLAWHPNVVEIVDDGYLPDGTSYLALELLAGESLAARVRSGGRMRWEELQPIALQICEALVAVHAAGVVHRDIKPANLFLVKGADGRERVKLVDFGIAHVEWEETRITNIGSPLGTPGYMSPEQESGGQIDARSDLFALGAVLYECLVGEPPPPTPSGMWLAQGDGAGRARADPAWELIPQAWRPIIQRALAPAREDRFEDARAFARAVRGLTPEAGAATS